MQVTVNNHLAYHCLLECHLHFKVFSDSTIIKTFFIMKLKTFAHKMMIVKNFTGKVKELEAGK